MNNERIIIVNQLGFLAVNYGINKMNGYVFYVDSLYLIAIIKGDDFVSIQSKFIELGYDSDLIGFTFSPAFGSHEGIKTDGNYNVIDCRG